MSHWYFDLEYSEMESCYNFLAAGSSDKYEKSFRHAIRLDPFGALEDVIRQLRGLADTIERRLS